MFLAEQFPLGAKVSYEDPETGRKYKGSLKDQKSDGLATEIFILVESIDGKPARRNDEGMLIIRVPITTKVVPNLTLAEE